MWAPTVFGQEPDTLYFSKDWAAATKSKHAFMQVVDQPFDSLFLVKSYYAGGQLKFSRQYMTPDLKIRTGWFVDMYENGTIVREIKYDRNKVVHTAQLDNSIEIELMTNGATAPNFPGGIDSLYHFLGQQTVFPSVALQSNQNGTIYVSFWVETDGSLTELEAMNGVGPLVYEALRVVKAMPKWTPGSERMQLNIPINFEFSGTRRDWVMFFNNRKRYASEVSHGYGQKNYWVNLDKERMISKEIAFFSENGRLYSNAMHLNNTSKAQFVESVLFGQITMYEIMLSPHIANQPVMGNYGSGATINVVALGARLTKTPLYYSKDLRSLKKTSIESLKADMSECPTCLDILSQKGSKSTRIKAAVQEFNHR